MVLKNGPFQAEVQIKPWLATADGRPIWTEADGSAYLGGVAADFAQSPSAPIGYAHPQWPQNVTVCGICSRLTDYKEGLNLGWCCPTHGTRIPTIEHKVAPAFVPSGEAAEV